MAQTSNLHVEAELKEIESLNKDALRDRWRSLFKSEPPQAFGPDLLRRSIAYRIQEDAYGGLAPGVRRELNRFVDLVRRGGGGKITLPQRIKPGSVLVRDWKGKTHRVMVLDKGFAWEGRTFSSLSEIASLITATRWNGPRFFGLRPSEKASAVDQSKKAPERKRRGRPPNHSLRHDGAAEQSDGQ